MRSFSCSGPDDHLLAGRVDDETPSPGGEWLEPAFRVEAMESFESDPTRWIDQGPVGGQGGVSTKITGLLRYGQGCQRSGSLGSRQLQAADVEGSDD